MVSISASELVSSCHTADATADDPSRPRVQLSIVVVVPIASLEETLLPKAMIASAIATGASPNVQARQSSNPSHPDASSRRAESDAVNAGVGSTAGRDRR